MFLSFYFTFFKIYTNILYIKKIEYNFIFFVGVATPTYILYNINFYFILKNGTGEMPVPFFII
nr:MAG TPA: hypothetical protein [Caudoviricetes sp.]